MLIEKINLSDNNYHIIELNKSDRPKGVPPNAESGSGKMRNGKPVNYLWRWKDKKGNWQYIYKQSTKTKKKKKTKQSVIKKRKKRSESLQKYLKDILSYESLSEIDEKRIRNLFSGEFNPQNDKIVNTELRGKLSIGIKELIDEFNKKIYDKDEVTKLYNRKRYLEIAFKMYEEFLGKNIFDIIFGNRGSLFLESNQDFYKYGESNVAGYITPVTNEVHIPDLAITGQMGRGSDPNIFRSRKTFGYEVIWHKLAHSIWFEMTRSGMIEKYHKNGLLRKYNSGNIKEFKTDYMFAQGKDINAISNYARKNIEEDFAESLAAMISHPDEMAKKCPNRYKFLQNNFFPKKLPKNPGDYVSGRVRAKKWWHVSLDPLDILRDTLDLANYLSMGIFDEKGDKYFKYISKKGRTIYFRTNEKYTNKKNKSGIKDIYDDLGRPIKQEDVSLMLGYKPRKYFNIGGKLYKKDWKPLTKSEFYSQSGCFNWDNFHYIDKDEDGNFIFQRKTIGDPSNPDAVFTLKVNENGEIVYPPIYAQLFSQKPPITDLKSLVQKFAENVGKESTFVIKTDPIINNDTIEQFYRVINIQFDGKEKLKVGGDYYNHILRKYGYLKNLDDSVYLNDIIKLINDGKLRTDVKFESWGIIPLEIGNKCLYRSKIDNKFHEATIIEKYGNSYDIRPELGSPSSESFTRLNVKFEDIAAASRGKKYDEMKNDLLIYKDIKTGTFRLKRPLTDYEGMDKATISSFDGVRIPPEDDSNQDLIISADGIMSLKSKLGGWVMTNDVYKEYKNFEESIGTNNIYKEGYDKEKLNPGKLDGLRFTTKLEGKPIILGEHQKNAVKFAIDNKGRAIYNHEMGTGKTLEGILTHLALKQQGMGSKTLFVVPASVLQNWQQEFENFVDIDKPLIIAGNAKEYENAYDIKHIDWKNFKGVAIVGHEYFAKHKNKIIRKNRFDTIIVDEAHKFKAGSIDPKKRSKLNNALRESSEVVNNLILMSGTFITDTITDLPEYLRIVSNGFVDLGSKEDFKQTFVEKDPITGKMTMPKNLPKLTAIVSKYMHIVNSSDVRGKVMPIAKVDEQICRCNPTMSAEEAFQTAYYKAIRGQISDEELEVLKQMAAGTKLEDDIDKGLKTKINKLRDVANCPTYRSNEGDKFINHKVEIIDKHGSVKGTKSVAVKYPEKLPSVWPSNDFDVKIFKDFLLPAAGFSVEEIEKIQHNIYEKHNGQIKGMPLPDFVANKKLPKDLVNTKIQNPYYDVESIINVYRKKNNGPIVWHYDQSRALWFVRTMRKNDKGGGIDITYRDVTTRKEQMEIYKSMLYGSAKAKELRRRLLDSLNDSNTHDEELVFFGGRIVPSAMSCVAVCETCGLRNVKDALKNPTSNKSISGKYYATYIGSQKDRNLHELFFRKDKNGNPLLIKMIKEHNVPKKQAKMLKEEYDIDVNVGLTKEQENILRNVKVMVGSDAMQVGINLGNADQLIMYDSLFSPTLEKQRMARITRMVDESDDPKIKELWKNFQDKYNEEMKNNYGIKSGISGTKMVEGSITTKTSDDIINDIILHMKPEDAELLKNMGFFKSVKRLVLQNPIPTDPGDVAIAEAAIIGAAKSKERGIEKAFLALKTLKNYIKIDKLKEIDVSNIRTNVGHNVVEVVKSIFTKNYNLLKIVRI